MARRLLSALQDLSEYAPPDRQPPLMEQLGLLKASTERATRDPRDLQLARHPDALGLGVAAGATSDGAGDTAPAGEDARAVARP